MNLFKQVENWKDVLDRLSAIREQEDYTPENVEYIRESLQSPDEKIRGGAALAAEGCLLEPHILDLLIHLAENDSSNAIRKAALQSLGGIIYEGVMQDFESPTGPDTALDESEEWDEIQLESLREDYLRTKNLLFSILQNEEEDLEIREAALMSLSNLGFLEEVREWISDFIHMPEESARLVALHAMGKFPLYWIQTLSQFLEPGQPKPLLLEAISSSYASDSELLARKIEQLLSSDDPDILSYALLTLANLNKTENLGEILQNFSLHQDERVRKAAREGIEHFTRLNFERYIKDEFGFQE
jgi:HEAT repeat protein